jgi:16S rRNA (cytidine1402-2'-O)-methyltransferase
MDEAAASHAVATPLAAGRLVLVPNTLDHGSGVEVPLDAVLPMGVIARAARITHWVVEDARSARAFLERVRAVVPLALPLQQQAIAVLPRAPKGRPHDARPPIAPLLAPALQGHELGLLSEAGLPALADPGTALVAAAHAAGIAVEALPGPSSIALAVAASGLHGQSFTFVGYLPSDEPARSQRIRALDEQSAREGRTQVAIETPYRNRALMQALIANLSPRTLLGVACGLTLPQGLAITRSVGQWRERPCSFAPDHPAVFSWLRQAPALHPRPRPHPTARERQADSHADDVGRDVRQRRRP